MKLYSDWHIHTEDSCDGACIPHVELIEQAANRGILDFGITDHIHTPVNLPDVQRSRQHFDQCKPSPHTHFGVEVSCVSAWELAEISTGRHGSPVYGLRTGGPAGADLAIGINTDDIAKMGIEYVVGGTHWPIYIPFAQDAVIRDYHRQNLFLARHPLVDIVAHPWWWMGHWQDSDGNYPDKPWLNDFSVIPQSMHDEFAATCREHETAVEVNIEAMLLNPRYPASFAEQYVDYLAGLQAAGVILSIGSDCHNREYNIDFAAAARILETAGIKDSFWRLGPRQTTA